LLEGFYIFLFTLVEKITMILSNLFLAIGPGQIAIIVVLVLLFFGGKKIPELMKGLGSGIKEFKKGVKEEDSIEESKKEE
jgi:sec-independent protein translocase protein TatA